LLALAPKKENKVIATTNVERYREKERNIDSEKLRKETASGQSQVLVVFFD